MKKIVTAGLLGCLFLAWSVVAADAGVYTFAEPRDRLGKDLLGFHTHLLTLRDIGNVAQSRRTDPDRPIRGRETAFENPLIQRHVLVMMQALSGRAERLTVDQKLNLSAYLLRCQAKADVHDLLYPVARGEPDNFLILANLATAAFQLGELDRAIFYQQQALEAWPERYDQVKPELKKFFERGGWGKPLPGGIGIDHEFYRSVEEHFLTLLLERATEKRKAADTVSTVDALFKDEAGQPLRFVNEEGKYEPGKLAASERAKLPKNHLEILQQLLLWLPDDNRLFWLYGEVLAADGHIKAAKDVFSYLLKNELVHAEEFHDHRKIIERIPTPLETIEGIVDVQPSGPQSYPYRHVVMSFLMGILIGLFAVWQFRELRRRRQRRSI